MSAQREGARPGLFHLFPSVLGWRRLLAVQGTGCKGFFMVGHSVLYPDNVFWFCLFCFVFFN
jgi:hypothetical protein